MNLTLAKMAVCAAAVTAAILAPAAERLAGGLGAPTHADREVSATFALPPPSERNWRLALAPAVMTASNRVEAALGFDADADGALDDFEVSAVVGFDRGAWFVRGGGDGPEERWTAAPSPAGGPLVLDIRLSGAGGAGGAAFRDGGGPLAFAGLPSAPAWLNPSAWNAVRLSARGAGAEGGGRMACAVFADGLAFILK
jgi:hypothetical protein